MIVFLDSGPLGLLTNRKATPITTVAATWAAEMRAAGHRLMVPAIADYEVRRELERIGSTRGLHALDEWNQADPGRYLPLTDSALRLASKLWARARNAGSPTADRRELDGDVLIAAQIIDYVSSSSDVVIATGNVGHLAQFVSAKDWRDIDP